jgi:hypothetical protein
MVGKDYGSIRNRAPVQGNNSNDSDGPWGYSGA